MARFRQRNRSIRTTLRQSRTSVSVPSGVSVRRHRQTPDERLREFLTDIIDRSATSVRIRAARDEPCTYKISCDLHYEGIADPFHANYRITVSDQQLIQILGEEIIEDMRAARMSAASASASSNAISFDNREGSLDGCDLEDPITGDVLTPDRVIRLRVNGILRCYDVVTLKMVIYEAQRNGVPPREPTTSYTLTPSQIQRVQAHPFQIPAQHLQASLNGNAQRNRNEWM